MPTYAAPGVYVEEVPGGSHPIGAVGTSTVGFVGTAPNRSVARDRAVPVNNWTEFAATFLVEGESMSTPLVRAVYGFFANGGGRCYIVNVEEGEPIAGGGRKRSGLQLLEPIDEIAIVAAPGYTDALAYEALLTHCEPPRGDRVAILDGPAEVEDVERLTRVMGSDPRPVRRTTTTSASSAPSGSDEETDAGTETPPGDDNSGLRPRQSAYGALYVPWLVAYDPVTGTTVPTPPSGHVAGVWARNDTQRGVHKAPANEPIAGGVVDLTYQVTRQEQELLNPKGVNCIRAFADSGIRIWGARTLAAEASEWRYLNVRRLFNMLKESIEEGTNWIVFEPNDHTLWTSIRCEIRAFLTRVWNDGALFGRTPAEAFFVKCDEETNPPHVRDAGQVVALIGVAPVKPAEFVVFKLSQSMAGAESENQGA
ncbi:phage tail sheath family protein [Actinopolymorpha alba]|uniref:phage tail sheath family protein n=1 Tax=Actinopolymorpha alba TaxID=533267 RepID=UPI0003670DDF|nr:phage tail sheath C-terminal domain-containing protein [Actinopolymorpha alba]